MINKDIVVQKSKIIFKNDKSKFFLYEFINNPAIHTPILSKFSNKKLSIHTDEIPKLTESQLYKLLSKFQIQAKLTKKIKISAIKNYKLELILGYCISLLIINKIQNSTIETTTLKYESQKINIEENTNKIEENRYKTNHKIANFIPIIFKTPLEISEAVIHSNKIILTGHPFNADLFEEEINKLNEYNSSFSKKQNNEITVTIQKK